MTKPKSTSYVTYWCATGMHGGNKHGGHCPIVIKWHTKTWVCTCECHTEEDVAQRHQELLDEELGPISKTLNVPAAVACPEPRTSVLLDRLRVVLGAKLDVL